MHVYVCVRAHLTRPCISFTSLQYYKTERLNFTLTPIFFLPWKYLPFGLHSPSLLSVSSTFSSSFFLISPSPKCLCFRPFKTCLLHCSCITCLINRLNMLHHNAWAQLCGSVKRAKTIETPFTVASNVAYTQFHTQTTPVSAHSWSAFMLPACGCQDWVSLIWLIMFTI